MTLGDLVSGLKGMVTPSAAPAPTTVNMARLQAAYQQYATDAMTRGQTPASFQDWVQQQVRQ